MESKSFDSLHARSRHDTKKSDALRQLSESHSKRDSENSGSRPESRGSDESYRKKAPAARKRVGSEIASMLSLGYPTAAGEDQKVSSLSAVLARQRLWQERRASSWMNAISSDSDQQQQHGDSAAEVLEDLKAVIRQIGTKLDQLKHLSRSEKKSPRPMTSRDAVDDKVDEAFRKIETTLLRHSDELQSIIQRLRMFVRCALGFLIVSFTALLLGLWFLFVYVWDSDEIFELGDSNRHPNYL
mmetsp:Transcript_18036/g.34878  ORF Transcript_18036/g.34878 Transcript_18036/m.34878 type:complete len:242 (+) Transcript_18036:24-749(+)